MPIQSRSKALDALGQPLDPTRLYEPLAPHALGHKVYNPDSARLAGDHEAVLHAPHRWLPSDVGSEVKGAARAASMRAALAPPETNGPDPGTTIILGPIPRERRRVALRNYHDKAGRIIHAGSVWDANDDFVKGNPDMFGPEAA